MSLFILALPKSSSPITADNLTSFALVKQYLLSYWKTPPASHLPTPATLVSALVSPNPSSLPEFKRLYSSATG